MMATGKFYASLLAVGIAVLSTSPTQLRAQQDTVSIGDNDLGGVVTSAKGPEAGVWVIAETTELPTKFAKIVVTDDRGRYLMPDLPKANYSVWVRGYGLVDFAQGADRAWQDPEPHRGGGAESRGGGRILSGHLLVLDAEGPGQRASFPAPGRKATASRQPSRARRSGWTSSRPNGCYACHQLGNKATRTIPKEFGHFKTSTEAWERRIQSGQASDPNGDAISAGSTRSAHSNCSPIGPIASPPANCPPQAAAAAGRRAQRRHHAVGLGRSQRSTCTTKSPPISATPPSTPTA